MDPIKIVGAVPTRGRLTSGGVATALLEIAEQVFIAERDVPPETFSGLDSRIHVFHRTPDSYICDALNRTIQAARLLGAEYWVRSDDDLRFPPLLLAQLLAIMEAEPWLGSVCALSATDYHWSAGDTSNKDFLLRASPSALMIVRMAVFDELGMFRFSTMEDIELGLRMWDAGWATGKLMSSPKMVFAHTMPRVKKSATHGGQPPEERNQFAQQTLSYLSEHYTGPMGVLKWLKWGAQSTRTYSARYNWPIMLSRLRERWGVVGYTDNKWGAI